LGVLQLVDLLIIGSKGKRMLGPSESREIEMRQLAIVAHELRNPLSAAWCAIRTLGRASRGIPEVEEALPLINQQLGYLARIVDDLVDVSSVACGRLTLHKQRVDISSLLRSAIDVCHQRVDLGRRELHVQMVPGPIVASADPLRLTQVFSNLLDNAVKHGAPRGRLGIGLAIESERGIAVVTVEDDGIGISADMLPRVFDLFVQGGTPATGAPRGLGVGLAVAKQIVEAHGGRICAHSAGAGAGSRFTVQLPLGN